MEEKPQGSPQLSIKERAKIQAQLGNVSKQIVKAITGKKQETSVYELKDVGDENFGSKGTLYFKNCVECDFVVNAPSVKVLIEGCKQCKITINGHVKTEILEIWRCDDFHLTLNTAIKTLQADICTNIVMHFEKSDHLGSLVWAGIQQLSIKFGDSPENNLVTGLDEMAKEVEDLKPDTDQFIARFLDGKLTQELVVRLENGFPTTEREANDFDEKAKKNAEMAEAYVRKLVEESNITIKPKEEVERERQEQEQKKGEKEGETNHADDGAKAQEKGETGPTDGGKSAPAGATGDAATAPGAEKEGGEEDRQHMRPAREPSKRPSRVYIGME